MRHRLEAADPANPTGARTNNFGFVSPHDFPFAKTRNNQFLIGIFGGSVAAWFCHVGTPRLLDTLKAQAFFKDRELVPLCFSHEGYKQPQQLLALTYFLSIGQQFDLVINIDGFNEVALAAINDERGLDISMPSPMHMEGLINVIDRSTLTPERLRSMAAIDGYRERLNTLAERLRRTRFAAVHVSPRPVLPEDENPLLHGTGTVEQPSGEWIGRVDDSRHAKGDAARRANPVHGYRLAVGAVLTDDARDAE